MVRRGIIASLVILPFIVASRPVLAHGFGERYDLPIPLGYFLVGASLTIILSFVIIGLEIFQIFLYSDSLIAYVSLNRFCAHISKSVF